MKLNLGCGGNCFDGWVNTDRANGPGVDQVVDLDTWPWPWPDESADEIKALQIFEHVDYPLVFMSECHRILRPAGLLHIRTAYWKHEDSYTDPTHRRFCTEKTMDYWIPGTGLRNAYGRAYAGNAAFSREETYVTGSEVVFTLRRL